MTLVNDPIYGLLELPKGLVGELINHRYVQRLRRISQLGFTHYVYPGATHHRFSHALGALHLMQQALQLLRKKGIEVSEEEEQAACIAILLHDLGHGPFSHSLEGHLIRVPHEAISIALMEAINEEYGGALDLALSIFKGTYPKKFLHQLVSSQLDMDRMDYLSRDSFFTGVNEGIIGYNRLLQMLNVHEGELVIGMKGIYSVEKFLIARRLMYWQVYLHKTVVVASEMNVQAVRRAKDLLAAGEQVPMSEALHFFLSQDLGMADLRQDAPKILDQFEVLDDVDLIGALKIWSGHRDPVLRLLSQSLLQRRLFAIHPLTTALDTRLLSEKRAEYGQVLGLGEQEMGYLVGQVQEANKAYQKGKKELKILQKDGTVQPISNWAEHHIPDKEVVKYFWYHPRV